MNEIHTTHDWTPHDDIYRCTGCTETRPACNTCHRPNHSSMAICTPCLTTTRRLLTRAENAYRSIPDGLRTATGLQAIRYDKHRSRTTGLHVSNDPGPDDPDDLRTLIETNPNRHHLELTRDPTNVLAALHDIADDWSDTLGTTWHGNVFTWLSNHILWAAQNHPAWNDHLKDIRTAVRRFYDFAGLTPKPDRAPCVHCGGTIVQDWADRDGRYHPTGLSDMLRCTRCGTRWNDYAHLDPIKIQTVRAAPVQYPDTLVTLKEARAALRGVKRNTINKAISRDRKNNPQRIPEHGTNRRGETLYRLGDIAKAVS